jgi:hypothetical protein
VGPDGSPFAGRAGGSDAQKGASQPLRRSLVHQFARDREEPGVQASAADAGEPVRCGEMRSGAS